MLVGCGVVFMNGWSLEFGDPVISHFWDKSAEIFIISQFLTSDGPSVENLAQNEGNGDLGPPVLQLPFWQELVQVDVENILCIEFSAIKFVSKLFSVFCASLIWLRSLISSSLASGQVKCLWSLYASLFLFPFWESEWVFHISFNSFPFSFSSEETVQVTPEISNSSSSLLSWSLTSIGTWVSSPFRAFVSFFPFCSFTALMVKTTPERLHIDIHLPWCSSCRAEHLWFRGTPSWRREGPGSSLQRKSQDFSYSPRRCRQSGGESVPFREASNSIAIAWENVILLREWWRISFTAKGFFWDLWSEKHLRSIRWRQGLAS